MTLNDLKVTSVVWNLSESRTSINTLCLKKYHIWLAIILTYTARLQQFLVKMLPRKQAIKMYFIFPPHLTNASALPRETGNLEIVPFHLYAAYFLPKNNTKHS